MPVVLFVRHGESHANAGLPTAHPLTVKLTKKGLEQVESIPPVLQKYNLQPKLIIISSYARSKQTAMPTRLTFPLVPVEEWTVHEFTYLSSWHATHSTVHQRRALVEKYWENCDPAYVDAPGSESFEEFIARVQEVIVQLKEARQNIIVVFSHEQFICALLWLLQKKQFEGKPDTNAMRNFRQFHLAHRIPNAAIVQVDLRDGLDYFPYEIITSHLE